MSPSRTKEKGRKRKEIVGTAERDLGLELFVYLLLRQKQAATDGHFGSIVVQQGSPFFAKKVHHHEANCLFIERVQFTFKKSGVKLTPRSNPTCNFISPRRKPKKTNEQKLAAPKNPCCSFAEVIFLL